MTPKIKADSSRMVDCLLLTLAIFIPYHQVAGHRFIEFDDGIYTFYNTYIIQGLTWESICWSFTNTVSANWHPLTWLSHLVDRELFGPMPGGYLLANVAWHTLASCLCYLAFRKTTGSRLFGFTVALIFALHPVNVENVAWASERKSLLNAVFWFAAIIAYVGFLKTRSFRDYGLTVVFFILSLLSKAMSVTLPCTLALVHVLYLVYHPDCLDSPVKPGPCLRKIVPPVLPLLALSLYFSAVTASAQSIAMAAAGYSLQDRLINVLLSYERYLVMFFHPTGLAVFYPLYGHDLLVRPAIMALAVLCVLSIAALLMVRKKPQLLIGWCWFLGTMVPAVGLVQVGSQSHADRYLYIPMLGLAFVFPVLFELLDSSGPWVRKIMVSASLSVLGVSMILATNIQVSYWRDGVTLFRHSLDVSGECVTSVMTLCMAYGRAERYDEMLAFADAEIVGATIEHKGKLATLKAGALFNMGKLSQAVETAQQALDWGDTGGAAYSIIAVSSYKLGHPEKAAQYLAKVNAGRKQVNKSNILDVISDAQITWLELQLKQQKPPQEEPPAKK